MACCASGAQKSHCDEQQLRRLLKVVFVVRKAPLVDYHGVPPESPA
jgi:hypothetical protein